MNTFDPFENERIRREWIAQERACRTDGKSANEHDVRVQKYRFIARLLADPPIDPIPSDFAAQTAARAGLAAAADNDALERWLERGLLVALAVVGGASMLTFGSVWLSSLDALRTGTQALDPYKAWGLLAAGCVVVSTVVQSRNGLFGVRS